VYIRQPIVSVMGHVDHGKTTLLDYIRKTDVAKREAGLITQHIGGTEVPLETIRVLCGALMEGKEMRIPGLLFIDTPGHEAFMSMRRRGGALADLAVLVIDIREGIMPQTLESIKLLRAEKTPFVICLNKIDCLDGWRPTKDIPFITSIRNQHEDIARNLDEKIYTLAAKLVNQGFPGADRYDRIEDFTKNIAMVPISAKTGEGVADLLLVLCGLAQRFLEKDLECEDMPGEGTILEIKEEKGLGTIFNVILYNGVLQMGDKVVVGTSGEPKLTKVKALLRPKPLDEIRDPRDQFERNKRASAACGLMVSVQDPEGVIAGAPLRVVTDNQKEVMDSVRQGSLLNLEFSNEGVVVVCDALGSCEALYHQCKTADVTVRSARVGAVSRRDIVEAVSNKNPENRVVMAFNTPIHDEAKTEVINTGVNLFSGNIIYKIVEDYKAWLTKMRSDQGITLREKHAFPAKVMVLPGCIFHVSKPAIVGVRVLGGQLRSKVKLMREDGKEVGTLKSIQRQNDSVPSAEQGSEVAISVQGAIVGRSFKENSVLYVDIPACDLSLLKAAELTFDEKEILEEIIKIKRKVERFWGM
jgi:translation initiation factor 5B